MKKRRELDALVNGKIGKNRKGRKGHELLRNDSDSSDVEEFSLPAQKTVVRKHGPSRFCSTCLPFCGFFLLTACVVAVAGLVWVHIELKNDLDHLRTQLRKVHSGDESSQTSLQTLHTRIEKVDKDINTLKSSSKLHTDSIAAMKTDIHNLQDATKNLQQSVAGYGKLIALPKDFTALSKTVASFGSDINTLKTNANSVAAVKSSLTDFETRLKKLEAIKPNTPTATPSGATDTNTNVVSKYVQQQIAQLSKDLSQVNSSSIIQINLLSTQLLQQSIKVQKLRNETQQLADRLGLLELTAGKGTTDMNNMPSIIKQAVSDAMSQMQNLSLSQSSIDSQTIDSIDNQILNISSFVKDFKSQFVKFKSDWESGKLDHINFNVTSGYTQIVNEALKTYTEKTFTQVKELSDAVTKLNASLQAVGKTVQNHHSILSSEALSPKSASDNVNIDTSTASAADVTTTNPLTTKSIQGIIPTTSSVHVDGINGPDGLTRLFGRIDKDGDGYVSYNDMKDFLGPSMPAPLALDLYDKNRDRLYTLQELMHAFGYVKDVSHFDGEPLNPVEGVGKRKKSIDSSDSLKDILKDLEGGTHD